MKTETPRQCSSGCLSKNEKHYKNVKTRIALSH